MPIVVEAEAFPWPLAQAGIVTEGSTLTVVRGEAVSAYRDLRVLHDARWSVYELGRTIGFFIGGIDRV